MFRGCLRWDFGFTCAFCLVHESDLAEYGIGRTGLTTVEHFVPLRGGAVGAKLAGTYSNCLYACRYCNNTRLKRPNVDALGRRLQTPCVEVWADHFDVVGDQLAPRAGDGDAVYTAEAYGINDELRLHMRCGRRTRLTRAMLVASQPRATVLLITSAGLSGHDIVAFVDEAFERHLAKPADAPKTCRCGNKRHHRLPPWLGVHTITF